MRTEAFTLIELIVAAALLSLLASYAIPSFRNFAQNNQLAACANKLVASIQMARSESVSRRLLVSVMPLADANRLGWDVTAIDGTLLERLECSGAGVDVDYAPALGGGAGGGIAFAPSGFRAVPAQVLNVTFCHQGSKGRRVTVSSAGSVSTESLENCTP